MGADFHSCHWPRAMTNEQTKIVKMASKIDPFSLDLGEREP